MKRFFFAGLLLPAMLLAQSDTGWARYDNPGMISTARAVATDGSGACYVTGCNASSNMLTTIKYTRVGALAWRVDVPNGQGNVIATDRHGFIYVGGQLNNDYVTIKYDASGNQRWLRTYDGIGHGPDFVSAMAVDTAGNVYVTGWADHDPRQDTENIDYVTIKYDTGGVQKWVATYDGPSSGPDWADGICIDDAGNCYVTGESFNAGTYYDILTVSYDAQGGERWVARRDDGQGYGDSGHDVTYDHNGGIYVCGYVEINPVAVDINGILLHYNATSGHEDWARTYSGPAMGDDRLYSVTTDQWGNAFATGWSLGTTTGYDFITVAYLPDGTLHWSARYNGWGNDADEAQKIVVDDSSRAYVAGYSVGAGTGNDFELVKYDTAGNQEWEERYATPGSVDDGLTGMTRSKTGDIFLTGFSGDMGNSNWLTVKISHKVEWTIMVYMNGDCDLEGNAIDDFNEMEEGINPELYNVVVQLDRIPGYDNSNGDWFETRRFLVAHDSTTRDRIMRSNLVGLPGEQDMGDDTTLARFVGWAAANYPAQRYCLIMWDHGSGWHKDTPPRFWVCADESQNDAMMVSQDSCELRRALKAVRDTLHRNLDVLCFDACLMGLAEVQHECKQYVNYVVNSENTVPGNGYPYTEILDWLNRNPHATPADLASRVVKEFGDSYKTGGRQHCSSSATLSAVNLGPGYDRFISILSTFASQLILAGGRNRPEILACRDSVQHFGLGNHPPFINENVDLRHFATLITHQYTLPLDLRNAATQLALEIDRTVIANESVSNSADSSVANACGIAAFYPTWVPAYCSYDSLTMTPVCLWRNFLSGDSGLPDKPMMIYDSNSVGYTVGMDTVRIRIMLRNIGGQPAQGLKARLVVNDENIILVQDTSSYPDCPSESIAQSQTEYVLYVKPGTPPGYRVTLGLDITHQKELGRRNPQITQIAQIPGTSIRGQDIAARTGKSALGPFDDVPLVTFSIIIDLPLAITEPATVPFASNPRQLSLAVFPNPFRLTTTICYSLPRPGNVSLKLYDVTGRAVVALATGHRNAGTSSFILHPSSLSRGVYLLRLEAEGLSATRKVVVE